MMRSLVLACILAASAFAAGAQESRLTDLRTGDDARGLEAIGRLDIGRNGFCTATLIAPDLILTAAHCLFDSSTLQPVDVSQLEFQAGLRNGRAVAYRNIRRAIPHPAYDYQGPSGDSVRVVNDLAVLQLSQPIRNGSVEPIATDRQPRKGEPVSVVSYAFDRDARPSLERACDVLARPQDMLVISCSVEFGSSGAPILVFTDSGAPRIVSVVSAKAKSEADDRPVALGTNLLDPLDTLLALARDDAPLATPRVLRQSSGGGAKFVKP